MRRRWNWSWMIPLAFILLVACIVIASLDDKIIWPQRGGGTQQADEPGVDTDDGQADSDAVDEQPGPDAEDGTDG